MAYSNFIPSVWNVAIQRDLERKCVFREDCYTEYEGSVKERGGSVHIKGIGQPTITTISKAERNAPIKPAEYVEDTSMTLYIDVVSYFNYAIGDIDREQSEGGVMSALQEETSEKLSNEVDKYIAGFATDKSVKKMYAKAKMPIDHRPSAEESAADKVYVLDMLDDALQFLQENDVADSTDKSVTVSPAFLKILKRAYRFEDTNNSEILKNGKVGKYNNVWVKQSNNVARNADKTEEYLMMRTKRAIAFVQPLTHTEAYRPEGGFADAIKGFILYGAKVIRPKEIITINAQVIKAA